MNQVCLHCSRQAAIGNLWCQETYCATGDKPALLEPGETLGDVEIIRQVAVLRTSVVYAAQRSRLPVLLKVAHAGMQERLKREAIFLAELIRRGGSHAALPALLPAYTQAEVVRYPYGKAVVQDHAFTYLVLKHTTGESLRDILLRSPQPWYQHAGWLVLMIADAIALMHRANRLHLCLSPESVLVRYDREGNPRPLLVDLGAVARPEEAGRAWSPAFVPPAYRAPELLGQPGSQYGAFTDVYGLGLILYEMLAGKPAFNEGPRPEAETRGGFLNTPPVPLNRTDLRDLPQVASRAISSDYRLRPPHVVGLARELQAYLPRVPKERQDRSIDWRLVTIVLSAAMAVTLLLALALSLGSAAA